MFLLQLDAHHGQREPEGDPHQEHPEHGCSELSKHLYKAGCLFIFTDGFDVGFQAAVNPRL